MERLFPAWAMDVRPRTTFPLRPSLPMPLPLGRKTNGMERRVHLWAMDVRPGAAAACHVPMERLFHAPPTDMHARASASASASACPPMHPNCRTHSRPLSSPTQNVPRGRRRSTLADAHVGLCAELRPRKRWVHDAVRHGRVGHRRRLGVHYQGPILKATTRGMQAHAHGTHTSACVRASIHWQTRTHARTHARTQSTHTPVRVPAGSAASLPSQRAGEHRSGPCRHTSWCNKPTQAVCS